MTVPHAKATATEVEVTRDLQYAQTDAGPLALDLYRPVGAEPAATVLYLHGGGWALGDKTADADNRLIPVAQRGVAVASVNYRLTDVATYPAQVHDTKAAVRWLRANGAQFGLATERLGAWGASAGGHLALMLGLTAGVAELDGEVGEDSEQDSSVQAVCEWFAPVDLVPDPARSAQAAAFPLPPFAVGPPPEPDMSARLIGMQHVEDDLEAARAASPLHHVGTTHAGASTYLIMHGDHDGLMPESESHMMHEALMANGIDSSLILLAGANHEGPEFDRAAVLSAVAGFFLSAL